MAIPARYFELHKAGGLNAVRALLSYREDLTFGELFDDVYIFPSLGAFIRSNTGRDNIAGGRSFVSISGGWSGYANPTGFAAEAFRLETSHPLQPRGYAGRPASFSINPWAGSDSALVVCTSADFIGSTWVGFIPVASIPGGGKWAV